MVPNRSIHRVQISLQSFVQGLHSLIHSVHRLYVEMNVVSALTPTVREEAKTSLIQLLPSSFGDVIQSWSLRCSDLSGIKFPIHTPVRPIASSTTECEPIDWLIQLSVML